MELGTTAQISHAIMLGKVAWQQATAEHDYDAAAYEHTKSEFLRAAAFAWPDVPVYVLDAMFAEYGVSSDLPHAIDVWRRDMLTVGAASYYTRDDAVIDHTYARSGWWASERPTP